LAGGDGDPFLHILSEKFQDETGVIVRSIELPATTSLYSNLQRLTTSQSPDVDILIMDVTWPGSLASHLIDLSPSIGDEIQAHDPALAANMMVDGRLVAMPAHLNFGMLYYRTDLLERYGYATPPATWDELDEMASVIQEGERSSNPSFAGFVFQGTNNEGLTCNALEWIASNGGGSIVDESGVTLENPAAIAMLQRASRWAGEIAPRGVLTYDEDASRRHFQAGSAAFMRNWAWVWWTGNEPGQPSAGKFDVAPLPSGPGLPQVATTGGQAFGVSAYSLHHEAAVEMVRYLSGPDVQRWQAVVNLLQPTIPVLYEDPDVQAVFPFRQRVRDVRLVPRPSNVVGAAYEQVSAAFSSGVTEILEGGNATEFVSRMADEIAALLG
jgi:trehalose/maltose transport system substrate-binding protein